MYILGTGKRSKGWTIADARRRIAEVTRAAAREPQALYNRDRLVGVVVDPDEYEQFRRWREQQNSRTLADDFAELRAICAEEDYELIVPERRDRPNPFAGE